MQTDKLHSLVLLPSAVQENCCALKLKGMMLPFLPYYTIIL